MIKYNGSICIIFGILGKYTFKLVLKVLYTNQGAVILFKNITGGLFIYYIYKSCTKHD